MKDEGDHFDGPIIGLYTGWEFMVFGVSMGGVHHLGASIPGIEENQAG
jgi:hypothetical protein